MLVDSETDGASTDEPLDESVEQGAAASALMVDAPVDPDSPDGPGDHDADHSGDDGAEDGADDGAAPTMPDRGAKLVLGIGTALWVWHFGTLVSRRINRFRAFDFDMGIYTQAVWLLAHGQHFMTVRGLPVLAHHFNLALYVFVPFSWLGVASPTLLSNAQTLSVGLCTIPLYLLARHRLGNPWLAVPVALVFLAHPSTQWVTWELFHPDVMAILPMMFAYYFSVKRNWRWFTVSVIAAMLWKEDVALAVVVLGLIIAIRGDRRRGFVVAGSAIVWFLLATRVFIPAFYDEPFYVHFFGDLGSSTSEIATNVLTDPSLVWDHWQNADAKNYVADVAAPYGYLSFGSPAVLMGLPQGVLNTLAVHNFVYDERYHYVAMPLTAATIGMIETLGLLYRKRRRVVPFAVAFVVGCAMLNMGLRGTSIVSVDYDSGIWPLQPESRQVFIEAAFDLVPDDAAVSATYQYVPPLAQRAEIYTFPNPWQQVNWAVDGENPRSPDGIEYLVLDLGIMGVEDTSFFESLIGSGEFRVLYDRESVVVAVREGIGV